MLTKEQILNADDLQAELVPVPEWGGDVLVRGLSGTERDAYEDGCFRAVGKGKARSYERDLRNARAKLCALCMIDEDGEQLFTKSDAAALGMKNAAALDRVFEVASRLSGLSEDDVEELAGNSESGQADESGTESPARSIAL